MRNVRRIGVALLIAFASAAPVFAQVADDRVSFNAAVGPSFASLGTTFSGMAGVDFKLTDRTTLVGEFGGLRHAPFREASAIAAPPLSADPASARVNAYHWNANLRVRPWTFDRVQPYVTGGVGSFSADTIAGTATLGSTTIQDRRRVTDFATNVGAGVWYRFNDWVGLGADYRSFFVHRDADTPRVDRFTTGLTFSLR